MRLRNIDELRPPSSESEREKKDLLRFEKAFILRIPAFPSYLDIPSGKQNSDD